MRLGSYDYVTKPLDLEELKILVARALDHARLSRELTYLREREQREAPLGLLLGECPEMQEVRGQIERFARMERQSGAGAPPVLILGETGHRQGARRAVDPPRELALGQPVHRGPLRRRSPRPSCSAGTRGRSPTRPPPAGGCSKRPTAGRCSSTRSDT